MWGREIRESTWIRRRDVFIRQRPVRDLARRSVGHVARVHQWVRQSGDGAQLDRHDVIWQTPTVGKSGQVPSEDPESFRILCGWYRHVEPQEVHGLGAGVV